ncbi:MAG TPA: BTAD domain-containing putative transcriptional regulator [Actinomycetota bacterium]|nr:BTAD domain-containing putative transcriptional regulator [Actinomycetota bacterium]
MAVEGETAFGLEPLRPPLISLLGGFSVAIDGPPVSLAEGSQRLLAFLALRGRPVKRQAVAGILWPMAPDVQGAASLRSALARLPEGARALVDASTRELGLSSGVSVDLWAARALARDLVATPRTPIATDPLPGTIRTLSADLLPDWYDDWVVVEAEGWRQLRLHALEALAERLTTGRRFGCASASAVAAVRAEPLRESPRAALIRVHIAEGNRSEALREFAGYSELLKDELGVEPTDRLRSLVDDLSSERRD